MSDTFYLEKGYTPESRFQSFDGPGTLSIWTPRSGATVILSGLAISSNLGGTIAFYWSTTSGASSASKFAEFIVAGSATITPVLQNIIGTAIGAGIWANVAGGGLNGFKVTATGFESASL